MNLFEAQSLHIGYQEKNAKKILQRDISVSLKQGEIVSLMGQNGVGKTTFIKTISGLLPPLDGEVFYEQKNLTEYTGKELAKKLAVVLTEKPFSLNISVIELIAIGRHPYSGLMGSLSKRDKEVIDWAINETHVSYLADKKLYQLSDGQLQKVMIARALAQESQLILLDEPAAHLDLYNKIEVMTLLRKIANNGKGILISTHDMQLSTQLSDRLWLFNFNEKVREGVPEDLILNGTLERTLYLQNYDYDMIHGTVRSLSTGPEISVSAPEEIRFWTVRALKRNGFQITESANLIILFSNETWILKKNGQKTTHRSIADLLHTLNKQKKD